VLSGIRRLAATRLCIDSASSRSVKHSGHSSVSNKGRTGSQSYGCSDTLTRRVVFAVSLFWIPTDHFSNRIACQSLSAAAAITTTKATTLDPMQRLWLVKNSQPALCRHRTVVPRQALLHHTVIMSRERRLLFLNAIFPTTLDEAPLRPPNPVRPIVVDSASAT
jgi:hypothetical protein